MTFQNSPRPRRLTILACTALWGAATLVAGADVPTISVGNSTLVRPTTGTAVMEFNVTRSGDASYPVTVGYGTQDGTAKAGIDYTTSRGVLTIPGGATSAAVRVPILPTGSTDASTTTH